MRNLSYSLLFILSVFSISASADQIKTVCIPIMGDVTEADAARECQAQANAISSLSAAGVFSEGCREVSPYTRFSGETDMNCPIEPAYGLRIHVANRCQ